MTETERRKEETEEGEDLLVAVRSSSHVHLRSQKNAPSQVALLHVTLSLLLFSSAPKPKPWRKALISGPGFQAIYPHSRTFPSGRNSCHWTATIYNPKWWRPQQWPYEWCSGTMVQSYYLKKNWKVAIIILKNFPSSVLKPKLSYRISSAR
ncbi:hypothetical protein MRB53_028534 [Persea americana]|uniref:Uncharacterized protein n=1 Tax=Persea americana TaxID=3435 RepID=A0ACC2KGB4_PERAE|nr:hypothetical protein MRB53_028534 [Persea americana]